MQQGHVAPFEYGGRDVHSMHACEYVLVFAICDSGGGYNSMVVGWAAGVRTGMVRGSSSGSSSSACNCYGDDSGGSCGNSVRRLARNHLLLLLTDFRPRALHIA